jgi:RNA polymerase sigma-54 factor
MNIDILQRIVQENTLSLKMQKSLRILQMNTLELKVYISNMMIENPVIDLDEFLEYDKIDRLRSVNDINSNYSLGLYQKNIHSLKNELYLQLAALSLSKEIEGVVKFLIENLDDNGYLILSKSNSNIAEGIDPNIFTKALNILRSFEPAGVGAATLSECLLLQVERSNINDEILLLIIKYHLELLAQNKLPKIAELLNVKIDKIEKSAGIIRSLNPKPGNGYYTDSKIPYIFPEIIVETDDKGKLKVFSNINGEVRLKVNEEIVSLKAFDDEAGVYITEKLKEVSELQKFIEQRKTTILKCAGKIIERQKAFFERNGNLVPYTMTELSQEIGVNISTVSRAVKGKYLQCSSGTYELKYFFKTAVDTDNNMSNDTVLKFILEIIDNEEKHKPYSDDKITELLNQRYKVDISRRTVSKYRLNNNIPNASQRKVY